MFESCFRLARIVAIDILASPPIVTGNNPASSFSPILLYKALLNEFISSSFFLFSARFHNSRTLSD